jgi:hypothetical protein
VPLAALAIAVVVAALPPLWQRQLAPENLRRPEDLPGYWIDAARFLDGADDGTRVLEVPGSDFTSYRWGTTVDPVTPGLMDRPMVARELVPMGSPPGANLLKAFDARLQQHIAEAGSVAPIARLLRSGHLLVRSDLAFEHYDTPRPRELWALLQRTPGLGEPVPFGPPTPNVAVEPNPMLDELALTLDPDLDDPPPVAAVPLEGPVPIAAVKPTDAPVVVAGDGDGLVDAAVAGLIDGSELVQYSAALSDAELQAALDDGAVLVVTDTNRRRGERWGSIQHTSGYTEPAGLEPLRSDPTDARLPVFTSGDDARTIAVHEGGVTANATSYGALNSFYPHLRPASAVDGDPTTAWRTGTNAPVRGERIELTLDDPVTASELTFLAPQGRINRWVTRVALRFDEGPPIEVDLDDSSRAEPGQRVAIDRRTFQHLSVEILADTAGRRPRYGGLTSTGFAEIGVGDVRLDEVVRLPIDLLGRAGAAARDHPLAVVLTRLRAAPTDVEHDDEERYLVRRLTLPGARTFRVDGTARVSPRTSDATLSDLLDEPAPVRATSSVRLPGRAHRASAALDGDRDTAWTTTFDAAPGQWLAIRRETAAPVDRIAIDIVADGLHSVPTRIGVDVDGARAVTVDLDPITDGEQVGATTRVEIPLPRSTTAQELRIVVEDARDVVTRRWSSHAEVTMPIALAEVDWSGASISPRSGPVVTGCRDDLLTVDGNPVPIRVSGTRDDADAEAGDALAIRTCDGAPLELGPGDHEVRAADGRTTGIDLDRLVLRSAAGGDPSDASTTVREEAGASPHASAPTVAVVDQREDSTTLRVSGATPGEPLWVAFGQSHNAGWEASIDGRSLGEPILIDGFANGWRHTPAAASFEVDLRFQPQRRVDLALWGSAAAGVLCLALAVRRPRRSPVSSALPEPLSAASIAGPPVPRLGLAATGLLAVLVGLAGLLVVAPVVGALLAVLAIAAARDLVPRAVIVAVPVAALGLAVAYALQAVIRYDIRPGLEWPSELTRAHPIAWFAVLALLVDVLVRAVRGRERR